MDQNCRRPGLNLSSLITKTTSFSLETRVAIYSGLPGRAATVGVWIDSGSRFEKGATNSMAHFMEHMVFSLMVRHDTFRGGGRGGILCLGFNSLWVMPKLTWCFWVKVWISFFFVRCFVQIVAIS